MAELPAQDIVERLRNAAERATRTRAERYHEAADFIEAQTDTISRLTADNEALRASFNEAHRQLGNATARADALAQEVERLKAEKENLQDVLQAAHDALKRDIPAKAFHAVRAAIRALANEEAGR